MTTNIVVLIKAHRDIIPQLRRFVLTEQNMKMFILAMKGKPPLKHHVLVPINH
jgi:hypothetical protein